MVNFTPEQVEEFLQEFFNVVGKRQYIGARYVPIFGRKDENTIEWNNLAPYEPLTVVMYNGVSYVSKQYVPNGIEITDTTYWVETYRFNAQVEQYRQEVLGFQGQINDLRSNMENDYVPFPDSIHYPKYGALGQVLTTLTNGETKWENPVVPSDAQAEEVITTWLNEHPEATTTVQNGAITDAKINANSTIFLFRGNLPNNTTALTNAMTSGTYIISPSQQANITDLPNGTQQLYLQLINIPYSSGNYPVQILTTVSGPTKMWIRYVSSSTSSPWITLYPSTITDSNIATDSTIQLYRGSVPNTLTKLSECRIAGCYNITRTSVSQFTDLPTNVPNAALNLINIAYSSNNYPIQVLASLYGELYVWYRIVSGDSSTEWIQLSPNTVTIKSKSVLESKKLVTAGDSYTAALFGSTNPLTGKNFGYYISQRNSMTFINSGISGSIMAYDKTYVDDPQNVDINTRQPFSHQRYLEVPADTDYLTIWFGINDSGHTYLGTINDTTSDTFYGAWNKVLNYYLINRPFMHVGIVVTPNAAPTYQQAVREVAAKWGYPVLDLVNGTDSPAFFERAGMSTEARDIRRNAYGWNTWNAHPNPEWHEFISSAFEEFLKRC